MCLGPGGKVLEKQICILKVNEKNKFASWKSMKKGVRSGVGSGSVSQRCGSADSQYWKLFKLNWFDDLSLTCWREDFRVHQCGGVPRFSVRRKPSWRHVTSWQAFGSAYLSWCGSGCRLCHRIVSKFFYISHLLVHLFRIYFTWH